MKNKYLNIFIKRAMGYKKVVMMKVCMKLIKFVELGDIRRSEKV